MLKGNILVRSAGFGVYLLNMVPEEHEYDVYDFSGAMEHIGPGRIIHDVLRPNRAILVTSAEGNATGQYEYNILDGDDWNSLRETGKIYDFLAERISWIENAVEHLPNSGKVPLVE